MTCRRRSRRRARGPQSCPCAGR